MVTDINEVREVRFALEEPSVGIFSPLLQEGFQVYCKTGTTVERFLGDSFGIGGEYLERRLNTVFLDGECIDDLKGTIVREGMTLALSSAMPGLAGAALRAKGSLAQIRASITRRNDGGQQAAEDREGFVTVKLFNILIGELGLLFLARGIYVRAASLEDILRARDDLLPALCGQAYLDGRPFNGEELARFLGHTGSRLVRLTVTSLHGPI